MRPSRNWIFRILESHPGVYLFFSIFFQTGLVVLPRLALNFGAPERKRGISGALPGRASVPLFLAGLFWVDFEFLR